MVDHRMCDYDDETEWRKRSGLEPLPTQKKSVAAAPKTEGGRSTPGTGGRAASPITIGRPQGGGSGSPDGVSSEVINLLSDSDGD